MASETTAAATAKKGVLRRDPMAMLPFCGYNFADYWSHWISFDKKTNKLPKIFHINWFRKDNEGKFLWPGFNENLRVLRWIIDRCDEKINARETAIGFLPHACDIDTSDLDISQQNIDELLSIDENDWIEEINSIGKYILSFGERVPIELINEYKKLSKSLNNN